MTTPPIPPKSTGPILELPADLELVYANLARIAHSPADIVLDFAHLLPGEPRAKIKSRVVMTPLSAKLLVRALTENIARYETAFGEIAIPPTTLSPIISFVPFNSPPNPQKNRRQHA
ncbi:DUF3467 domain-containing protein [Candidatus Villigracilis affinis]|uniref:DUF3467 domain-containing protein n=1 Tax=Candidatus Villigracilis affinis TaxID=3140682 RepID=UPI002A2109AF|nr:DUF3467 domain-containing protein [Anaerolineales bacterium]